MSSYFISMLSEFRIVYLAGPRQAGKTTLVKGIAKEFGMAYFTLDDVNVLKAVSLDPMGFLKDLGDKKIIIDEFQYAPQMIPAIKECSDALTPNEFGKFILTGSADVFRSAKVQEALPGHMARLELYPLSVTEKVNYDFNIINFITAQKYLIAQYPYVSKVELASLILEGGYPEVQNKSVRGRQVWFQSYIDGRLFKDFESLYSTRGDYHSKLNALIHYIAGISGNLLKYANVGNDLELNDKLIKSYLEILEYMFIIKRTPAYLKNSSKRQASMPKLHFVDSGLACYLLGIHNETQLINSQFFGGLLESYIYMELIKQASWSDEMVNLLYFRDTLKNEVDIVLECSNGDIFGIEIKASSTLRNEDFKGLKKLAEFAGVKFKAGLIFYNGDKSLPFNSQGHHFYALPFSMLFQPACR